MDRIRYQNQLFTHHLHHHPFLLQKDQPTFYEAKLGFRTRSGIREQPFDTQQINQGYFRSASVMKIGSWMTAGTFNYHKTLKSVRPYLLQTSAWDNIPYRLMDKDTQAWSGDEVDFRLTFTSPEYGRTKTLQTIGALSYKVGTHSRNAEPRPLARISQYTIRAGQSIKVLPQTSLGAGIQIVSGQEENHIGAFAVQDVQIYQGRGWGTYTLNTYQSFQRTQKLQGIDGFLYLHYQKENVKAFTEVTFKNRSYEARDGVAFPVNGGTSKMTGLSWIAGIGMKLQGSKKLESIVTFDSDKLLGTDPIFSAINVENKSYKISWENLGSLGPKGAWQLRLQLQTQLNKSEDFAAGEVVDVRINTVEAAVLKSLTLGSTQLYINPLLKVWNAYSDMDFDESNELSRLLLGSQQAFYSRSFLEPALNLKCKLPIMKENQIFFESTYSHRLSSSYPLRELSLSIQLLF
ncbi:DUF6850 family outer membrane beta-barrel protein [Algoriphagus sp. Y33]|uniref:DUF6850 family outer membrane beta-barrel protein n=1 Tax=Algoriphagus sp. Y33 TaxID=2772483 RepID=UPI00177EB54E|nr:DUF6850 family outer membrane beta-barrel protein [Algoriphagus sp. Y33]